MNKRYWPLIVAPALLLGCTERQQDAAEDFEDATESAMAAEMRDFRAGMKNTMAEADEELAELEARAEAVGEEVDEEWAQAVNGLREERREFARNWEQMEAASEAEWRETRTQMSQQWNEFEAGLTQARLEAAETREEFQAEYSEEMAELFVDIPEAYQNAVEIAKRCNLTLDLGTPSLPNYPVPDDRSLETFLEDLSREGLEDRLQQLLGEGAKDEARRKPYFERLDMELGIINQMGFPGYFLIVMEFIQWAKKNDIPVGPGRGSGAGSIVAYALGITDLDPLRYDLLFERFLNPERVSMPDFDVDFCMEGRDRVIQHVAVLFDLDEGKS